MGELLELVELPANVINRFPHEFSGGQRQRISIARAIAVGPRLVIADEPVSSLDVSVQSKILNLLSDLQERLNLTYLFISHDMSVVRHVADRVAVMYLGKIVEVAPAAELFANPQHPYTQALLSSVPALHRRQGTRRIKLTGDVPTAVGAAVGCRFASRCFRRLDRCEVEYRRSSRWRRCVADPQRGVLQPGAARRGRQGPVIEAIQATTVDGVVLRGELVPGSTKTCLVCVHDADGDIDVWRPPNDAPGYAVDSSQFAPAVCGSKSTIEAPLSVPRVVRRSRGSGTTRRRRSARPLSRRCRSGGR